MPGESLIKTIMDLLKRQQNQEGQTKNYMFEYCKFGNKFKILKVEI